jgi:hypothetical protein
MWNVTIGGVGMGMGGVWTVDYGVGLGSWFASIHLPQ